MSFMKVILITDVKKVGQRGEVKEVADGYAQNVLIPRKLALPGTAENLKKYQKEEERKEDKKAFDESLLIKTLKEIDKKEVTISANANEQGGLFETIHTKQVVDAIKKDLAVEVPESVFAEPVSIKQSGVHEVKLKVGKVNASVRVIIS